MKAPSRVENGPSASHATSTATFGRWAESKAAPVPSASVGLSGGSGFRSSGRRQSSVLDSRSEIGPVVYPALFESDRPVSFLGKRPARFWAQDFDDDYIPAHLIDVVARSLLNKRPRLDMSDGDLAEPVKEFLGQASVGVPVTPKVLDTENVHSTYFGGYQDLAYGEEGRAPHVQAIRELSESYAFKQFSTLSGEARSSHVNKAALSGFDGLSSCFDHDVIEVSSEGGSCQPSPEVPTLSLCDDLDDLAPLDLGVPAVTSVLHPTHTMTATAVATVTDLTGGSSGVLELGCGGGAFDDAHNSLTYSACQVCGVADGACMGSCEHVARCGLEGGDFLGHLDSPGGSVWDALHAQEQEDGATAWW